MTLIESVSRRRMQSLISSGEWGKLSEDQLKRLQDSIAATTHFWIGMVDKDLICAFGIAEPSFLTDRAYFWVWPTEKLQKHVFVFTRRSQIVVKDLLVRFETLFGHCDTTEPGSKRWLKWLGAKFGEADGAMIPFEIRRG